MIHRQSLRLTEQPRRYDIDRIKLARVYVKGHPYNVSYFEHKIVVVPANSMREVVVPLTEIAVAAADIL